MASIALTDLAPGLRKLRSYKLEWLAGDLVAGLSVAAVAIPVGIAYAQWIGFPPVVGIYSSILPLVAYALFGSSRQLIVNPDAAACAIIASTVAPLVVSDPSRYTDLAIALTLLTGIFCIAGGFAGLGVVANFLSRPILTGYLNGIALSIIIGQFGKLLGFAVASGGFFRTLFAVTSQLGETKTATAVLGISLFILILVLKRFVKMLPAPLIAAIVGIAAVYFLELSSQGVAIVGQLPAGFPTPRMPSVGLDDLMPLALGAAGITLVSFCSMMTTARGFAAKNGYTIDVNRDMAALGICDLSAGLSQGFVVSGAASRTAVADSSGSKSQMTGVFAAIAMALVLLFLTGPIAYVPITGLAAILISSAMGLFDIASVRRYYALSRPEFVQCLIATLGVMTIGVLPGILIAVGLAIFNLLRKGSKPNDVVLGLVEGKKHVYASEEDGGQIVAGLVVYRFDSSILFFNADHLKARISTVIKEAPTETKFFLLNAESCPVLDVTGADVLESIHSELAELGIGFGIARANGLFRSMIDDSGLTEKMGLKNIFSTVNSGVRAFSGTHS